MWAIEPIYCFHQNVFFEDSRQHNLMFNVPAHSCEIEAPHIEWCNPHQRGFSNSQMSFTCLWIGDGFPGSLSADGIASAVRAIQFEREISFHGLFVFYWAGMSTGSSGQTRLQFKQFADNVCAICQGTVGKL